MANKIDEYEFNTEMTLREIERVLNQAYAKIGVEDRRNIGGSSAALAVEVSGKTAPFSPFIYVLEIYVWNNGEDRTVQVNVLGSGAGTWIGSALRQQRGEYIDLKYGKKKRDIILRLFNEI